MVSAQCTYTGSSLRIRTETETGLSRSPLPVGIVNQIEAKQVRALSSSALTMNSSFLGHLFIEFPTILFEVDAKRQRLCPEGVPRF